MARNPANFEDVAREINNEGGKAIGISADLSDANSVQAAFKHVNEQFGSLPLAAAVFNLGGGFVKKPFLELTETEYEQGFNAQGYVQSSPTTLLLASGGVTSEVLC